MAFKVSRIISLLVFFMFFSSLLIIRLFYLQVLEGPKLAMQSLGSRMQEVPIEVARGEIVDCNGVPLTNTTKYFSIVIFPGQVKDIDVVANKLMRLTGIDSQEIIYQIKNSDIPFRLQSKVEFYIAQKINSSKIPGVMAVAETSRYNSGGLAAHLIGYINLADNNGVSGIESMYNDMLRGHEAEYAAVLVDAAQRVIPGLGYKRLKLDFGSGPNNVVLTIDKHIQQIVENIMDRHTINGAVVVMNPHTGGIIAMASRPGFDANNLSNYFNQAKAPLLNRALLAYQPGSVFKLVVAAAAFENGIVSPDDVFFDRGYIEINDICFRGWDYEKGGRGLITFREALAYSSNPVFIEVGQKLGAEKLISCAQKLGFGQITKLNFDCEGAGNLPSIEDIYPGELANLSIGQGVCEATPLQICSLVATIVNDGIKVEPYVVNKIVTPEGNTVKSYNTPRPSRVLSKKTAGYLKDMMSGVTAFGTGKAAYVTNGGSAGKTGSAETGRTNSLGQGISHAWFAGYAPLINPQYVVTVFVEDGMSGGDVAAPMFAEIMTELINN